MEQKVWEGRMNLTEMEKLKIFGWGGHGEVRTECTKDPKQNEHGLFQELNEWCDRLGCIL